MKQWRHNLGTVWVESSGHVSPRKLYVRSYISQAFPFLSVLSVDGCETVKCIMYEAIGVSHCFVTKQRYAF
jgi:hypothetical protein